jgi:hypothetical protein
MLIANTHAPQTSTIELNPLPDGAKVITFGHRSGAESHMRCPRAYYLNYEYLGRGITPTPGPLYFAIGSAIHHGLAAMLLDQGIDAAVERALTFLVNTSVWGTLDPDVQIEQEVLVHGLLYAFWVWAYPSIKRDYEVLCVETGAVEYVPVGDICVYCEGINDPDNPVLNCKICNGTGRTVNYIAMQSRPDAILRNKLTGEVAGWSWKTIDDPTDLRRSQFHNDLQGFMEMHYGERVLEKLRGAPVTLDEVEIAFRSALKDHANCPDKPFVDVIAAIRDNLGQLEERARAARNIPTTIDYIQTVFLVKGQRRLLDSVDLPWINSATPSSDTDEWGGYAPDKQYKQMSPLCYRYRNGNVEVATASELYKGGPNKGKPKPVDQYDPNCVEESWAYRFFKPGNASQSALSTKWLTSPIQPDQIREWVDRLATGSVYPTTMNDERNVHPLNKLIQFDQPLYRNAVKALAHVQQQQRRYVQIAKNIQDLNAVTMPDGLNIEALDALFPQHLINCRTPYRCAYHSFCHTPQESELDFKTVPNGFELRDPHHEKERELRDAAE